MLCLFLLLHLAHQLTPATLDYTRLATFNGRTLRFLILSIQCRAGSRFQTRQRHGRDQADYKRPFRAPATARRPFCTSTSGKSSTQRRFFMYSSCRTLSTTSCVQRQFSRDLSTWTCQKVQCPLSFTVSDSPTVCSMAFLAFMASDFSVPVRPQRHITLNSSLSS